MWHARPAPRTAGFEQLCRLDARFEPFGRTLFAQSSLGLERDQQPAEANARLDASIDAFCCLLSSYFLLQPATRALEYLVRRYRRANSHGSWRRWLRRRRRPQAAPPPGLSAWS